MQIIGLKLTTGQDVIGRVVSETADVVVISYVRLLIAQPGPQGVQIAMPPWTFLNIDGECTIHRNMICMSTTKLAGDIERGYIQSTSNLDLSSIM